MITQLPNLNLIFPELSVLVMSCVTLLSGLYLQGKAKECVYWLAQFTLVNAFVMTLALLINSDLSVSGTRILYDMIVIDKLGCILKLAIYVVTFAVLVYGRDYVRERGISPGEYYALILFAVLGMLVAVSSNHLLTLFLALELLSLPIYALVAVLRDSAVCTEAAVKYFVMGALATGILLYGFSIVYGVTGSLDFSDIASAMSSLPLEKNSLAIFGLVFALVGLAFKLGMAPFHMWVPDVYEGAPTSVTLLIATAPKLAVFGMLMRLLTGAMPGLSAHWQELLIVLSVTSIAIGNLIAVVQTNIRRLLAYSSIAHMGYMVLGIVAVTQIGYGASLFYIITYVLTSLAIFGFILTIGGQQELQGIRGLSGLNQRNPWLAFMALITLFAMAGIPPIVGFMAKLSVLTALIDTHLVSLAIVAMLFAVVGVYYYVHIIKVMYFEAPEGNMTPIIYSKTGGILLTVNCLVIVGLGIFPAGLLDLCQSVFM